MINPEDYYPFCTSDEQRRLVEAIGKHGTPTKAGKAIGIDERLARRKWAMIQSRAAIGGVAPGHFNSGVAPGFGIGKVTIQRGPEGEIERTWERQFPRKLQEAIEDVIEGFMEGIPAHKAKSAPKGTRKDLLTVYPMGDPHIGMYAWHAETGEDFDCDIAERDLCSAIDKLVTTAQNSEEALIVNLGDFFHADTAENTTKRNKNPLDVDTRKQRVTQIGVRIMQYLIDRVLDKHNKITVINEVGNHDDESSYMLSLILDAYYRKDKRVTIDMSPATFHYFRFGKVMIGVTHGHNCKPDALGQIMATDRPQDWGETEFRYWLVGHIHHITRKEVPGCIIETFRTLAAKDAYHASHGYRSGRDMVRITYHKDYGETGREILGIKQIRAAK